MHALTTAPPFPHRCSHIGLKIVLRGNHDAPTERSSRGHRTLPRSGALLVGNRPGPTLIEVGGITLLAVPWDSKRDASTPVGLSRPARAKHGQHGAKKPKPPTPLPRADVILSHAPPYGVLDVNQAGVHCGSAALLERVVAGCKVPGALPPALWCFGHIHEGRGGEALDLYQGKPWTCLACKRSQPRFHFPTGEAVDLCQAAAAMRSAAKGHSGTATRFGTVPDALPAVAAAAAAAALAPSAAAAATRTTLCLNCSNANEGRASHWPRARPPLLVRIHTKPERHSHPGFTPWIHTKPERHDPPPSPPPSPPTSRPALDVSQLLGDGIHTLECLVSTSA